MDKGPAPSPQVLAQASLSNLHTLFDATTEEFQRHTGVPPCVEGCGVCCMVNTPTAIRLEANYLYHQLWLSIEPERREEIVRRALEWLEREEPGMDVALLGEDKRVAAMDGATRERLLAQGDRLAHMECPFFERSSRRCLVYEGRPLSCRAYGPTLAADPYCRRPRGSMETEEQVLSLGEGNPMVSALKGGVQHLMDGLTKVLPIEGVAALWPLQVAIVVAPEKVQEIIRTRPVAIAKLLKGAPRFYPGALWTSQQRTKGFVIDDLSPEAKQRAYDFMEKNHLRPQDVREAIPAGDFPVTG